MAFVCQSTSRSAGSLTTRLVGPRTFRKPLRCASSAANSTEELSAKRCIPCEDKGGALSSMGMTMALERASAEELLAKVDNWRLYEDTEKNLRIKKRYRTKNFVKALELLQRVGVVAEAEGHHPDLHVEGWNNVTIEVWTHSQAGLTENDFILAAKIDAVEKADLLSKKAPLPW